MKVTPTIAPTKTPWIIDRPWVSYVVTVGLTWIAALAGREFPLIMAGIPFLMFYPVVAISAILGGFGPGIIATAGATLFYILWFDPTPERFGTVDLIRIGIFIAGGAGVSFLAFLQQRREAELRESRREYSIIAKIPEENPDMVLRVSHDGNLLYANPAAKRMLHEWGWDAGTLVPVQFKSLVEQAFKSGGQVEKEIELGNEQCFVFTVKPVFEEGYVNLYGKDVTERWKAEDLLRQSEKRYRTLFDTIDEGFCLVEVIFNQANTPIDYRFLEVNPAFVKHTGLTNAQGKRMRELYPEHEEHWFEAYGQVALTGEPVRFQNRAEQLHRWYDVYAFRVGRPEDRHVAILFNDITGRIESDASLRRSEQRMRAIFDYAGVGIVEAERDNDHFIAANQQACKILGRSCERLLSMNVHELTWPEDRPLSDRLNRELHEGLHDQISYEKRYIRGDGSPVWVHMTVSAIRDKGRWVRSIATIEDITERKLAEDEVRAAKDYAENAKIAAEQANHAKDHFLAVLSHELRTPLTPVVMGVSMLQDRIDLDPKVRETLEMIRSNVEMEARLIDDLLDVTRIVRGKVELNRNPVELCSVIQRAIDVCKPDIEARRLHFGVDTGSSASYWVEADTSRLQQVFWNLLKNAIKFTPPGGCVGIRCRPSEEYVVVEVNDSGIGIEPDMLPRIFDAFEQAERSITRKFGGLGLGLAISKALVEMHGGEIEANSEGRDKGATFRIRLPLSRYVKLPEEPLPAVLAQRVVRPLRILLVEDHGVTAQLIRMILVERGHDVKTAADLATALELADRSNFDLLLSDLGLPDGTGHDLIRKLRLRGYQFPGIVLSGYGQEDDIKRSYEAGFAAHLTKPASRESIIERVESVATGNGRSMPSFPVANTIDEPIFDADEALKRCFGKREMLNEMVNFFYKDSVELLSQMHVAVEECDFAEAGRAAHRLKGSLVFLGAQPATDASIRVEQAAKDGDMTVLAKSIIELDSQVGLLRELLTLMDEGK